MRRNRQQRGLITDNGLQTPVDAATSLGRAAHRLAESMMGVTTPLPRAEIQPDVLRQIAEENIVSRRRRDEQVPGQVNMTTPINPEQVIRHGFQWDLSPRARRRRVGEDPYAPATMEDIGSVMMGGSRIMMDTEDPSNEEEVGNYVTKIQELEYFSGIGSNNHYFYSVWVLDKFPKEVIGQEVFYEGEKLTISGIEKIRDISNAQVILKAGLIGTTRVRPHHITFVEEKIPLDYEKIRKGVALELLQYRLVKIANESLDRLVREINEMSEKISYLNSSLDRDSAKAIEEQSKILKKKILDEQKNVKDFKFKDLMSEIKKIKSHPSVDKVFVSRYGELYIQTKTLKASRWDKKTPTRYVIGKMLFRLDFRQSGSFNAQAINLDHMDDNGYFHPQISGTEICLDAERKTLKTFLNSSALFALVDYLIMFISTPFQENATYYIEPEPWFAHKTKRESDPNRYFPEWGYKWEMN